MASFGMGFAQGMESGRRMAKSLLDIYEKSKLQREMSEVDNEKPTDLAPVEEATFRPVVDGKVVEPGVTDAATPTDAPAPVVPKVDVTPVNLDVPTPTQAPATAAPVTAATPVPTVPVTTPDAPVVPPVSAPAVPAGGQPTEPAVDPAVAANKPIATPITPTSDLTPVSPRQYKFLGKTYDQPLTDQQIETARNNARANILTKYDPEKGLGLRRQLAQDAREAESHGFRVAEWKERQEQIATEKKAQEAGRKAFANSYLGKAMTADAQDLSSWYKENEERQAKIAAGTPETELPPLREKPVRRNISPAQMLASNLSIMTAQVEAGGKFEPEKFANSALALQKLEEEGVGRALDAAAAGASVDDVAKLFNKSGQARFDPNNVISDVKTKDENGVPNRVITYFDPVQKRNIEINVNAERAAIGQAGAQLDRLYKISQINANNATIDLRKAQTDLYGAQLGATNAQEAERRARALLAENKAYGTVPSGSGSSTGNAQQDARLKDFDKSFDGFKDTNNPSLRTDAYRIGKEALGRNPGADPSLVAYAAQAYVTGSTKNIQPKLDFDTGEAVAVFTDDRTGKTVTLHSVKPTKEQAAALKPEVQVYLQQQEALGKQLTGKAGFADAMRRAAVNPKDAEAMRSVEQVIALQAIPTIEAELLSRWEIVNAREKAMKRDPLPKPTQQDAMDLAMRQLRSPDGMARLRRRLDLIRTYGQ